MSRFFDLMQGGQGSVSERHRHSVDQHTERSDLSRSTTLRGEVSPAPEMEPTWARSIEILRRNWRPAALFAALVVLTVAVVTLLTKPIYEPVAALQIDPPGTETFSMQSNGAESNSSEYISTQTKKLQGNLLGMEVVRNMQLERMPEFAGRKAITGADSRPDEITAAQNAALKTLQKRTVVTRDSASRLVYVSVGANDPNLAAAITNARANLFVEGEDRARHEAVMRSSDWLRKQLEDIRVRMDESNKTLGEFQRQSGIASINDNQTGNTFSEQMIELNKQLMQARADRIQLQAFLSRMDGHTNQKTLPQVSSNPLVQGLTQKLAETRVELTNSLVIYGTNHPNVRKLQKQADELKEQLDEQKAAILRDMKTNYQAAQVREGMVQDQVRDAGKQLTAVAQYMALKKEADANTLLYNSLSAKIREAGITAESKSNPIRIVDPAPILDRATSPRIVARISLGALLGISGGFVLAFIIEGLNTTVRTRADVKRLLGMVPVSIVPMSESDAHNGRTRGRLISGRQPPNGMRPLFLLERPRSPEAEALRSLYTSVRLSEGPAQQVILVTSPSQGEGKTTMTVNLAVALAEWGKTCVVDADLRKAAVAPAFGISAKLGLSDVLANEIPLDHSLVPSTVKNLTVLPAGQCCGDVARFVCSDAMAEVISSLRSEFEFVLVDSPPILPFADCRALSALVDGVVLISRSGQTEREALVRAMELFRNSRSAPVVQVVLNGVQLDSHEYSYYNSVQTDGGKTDRTV